jgi:hypothetical protein
MFSHNSRYNFSGYDAIVAFLSVKIGVSMKKESNIFRIASDVYDALSAEPNIDVQIIALKVVLSALEAQKQQSVQEMMLNNLIKNERTVN